MSIVMQINPFDFFVDAAGTALDAGYIWIGEPNKYSPSFPVAVFYDEALTIPAAMPLRTSNGYIVRNGTPTFLYIDGNYSILVQDKNNRQVFYVPDFLMIGNGMAVSASDLANYIDPLKGAGMVGWGRSPITSTIHTVHQMLDSEPVNIYEFADLVTVKPTPSNPDTWDWTPAMQAALGSARKNLVIHPGIYQISATCVIPSDSIVKLENGAVIQRKAGSGAFNMLAADTSAENILIHGYGTVDGNRAADSLSPTNAVDRFSGVHLIGTVNSTVHGISVIGTVNNETNGAIYLDSCTNVTVEETTITDNDRTGILTVNGTQCKIIRNTAFSNVGSGISSSNNVDNEYLGNVTYSNGSGSGTGYTGLNASGLRSRVIGNLSYLNGASGINVGEATHTADESVLIGNQCYSNTLDGFSLQNSTRLRVSNNVSRGNTRDGIRLFTNSTDCDIDGNSVIGNLGTGIFVTFAGHSIKNNRAQRNNSAGIYLETNTSLCQVLDNICHGNGVAAGVNASGIIVQGPDHMINGNRSSDDGTGVQLYGIWMAGATAANLVGNRLSGNITAAIRETSSPTYSTRANKYGTDLTQALFTATAASATTVVNNNNARATTRIKINPFNAAAAARPGWITATVVGTSFTVTFTGNSAGTEIYTYEID